MDSWVQLGISVAGGLAGVLIGAWITKKTSITLRISEVRFDGYVAIERFLITTHEQADFEVNPSRYAGAESRPPLDQIGPEAQAIANLVASKEVLKSVGHYYVLLNNFRVTNGALDDIARQRESEGDSKELQDERSRNLRERERLFRLLTHQLRATSNAMRKDLDLAEIDWSELERVNKL